MKQLKVFVGTWAAASVALYAFIASQVDIPTELVQEYRAGCGAVGAVVAWLAAEAATTPTRHKR